MGEGAALASGALAIVVSSARRRTPRKTAASSSGNASAGDSVHHSSRCPTGRGSTGASAVPFRRRALYDLDRVAEIERLDPDHRSRALLVLGDLGRLRLQTSEFVFGVVPDDGGHIRVGVAVELEQVHRRAIAATAVVTLAISTVATSSSASTYDSPLWKPGISRRTPTPVSRSCSNAASGAFSSRIEWPFRRRRPFGRRTGAWFSLAAGYNGEKESTP